jgi:hypothetical protein
VSKKALEAWPRAELVAEVTRLRAENEALKSQVAALKATSAGQAARALETASATPARRSRLGKGGEDAGERHVSFSGTRCVKDTNDGLLIRFSDGSEEWCPRSQVGAGSDVQNEGDEGDFVVTRWIAEQKGWV